VNSLPRRPGPIMQADHLATGDRGERDPFSPPPRGVLSQHFFPSWRLIYPPVPSFSPLGRRQSIFLWAPSSFFDSWSLGFLSPSARAAPLDSFPGERESSGGFSPPNRRRARFPLSSLGTRLGGGPLAFPPADDYLVPEKTLSLFNSFPGVNVRRPSNKIMGTLCVKVC